MGDFTPCCSRSSCEGCPGEFVCHCLKITEDMVLDAIRAGARTVQELSERIGAGDGCMACHARLEGYLAATVRSRLELVET